MSEGEPASTPTDRREVTAHDRQRLRVTRRVALAGPLLGALAAAVLGLLGAGGAAGLGVLLVLTASSLLLAAFVTAFLAMVDEYRRVHVARRRTVIALVLFPVAAFLLVLSAAVAATV
ncbi:MAG: hypothetical protein WD638_03140 [Nitriliruptoraceae bacterium]